MINFYSIAAFWLFCLFLSAIIAHRLKILIALMEIITGALIGFMAFKLNLSDKLFLNVDWMKSSTGIITEPILENQIPDVVTTGK